MASVENEALRNSVLMLLKEAYPGGDPNECWFTWGGPESGVLGTLDGLTAQQASAPAHDGGTTVAAIAAHLLFTMRYGNMMWAGQKPDMDWDDSWPLTSVTEDEWASLRDDLRREYDRSVELVESFDTWSFPKAISGSFGHIAHTAYHLGAIRQIAKQIKG